MHTALARDCTVSLTVANNQLSQVDRNDGNRVKLARSQDNLAAIPNSLETLGLLCVYCIIPYNIIISTLI